ncbi:MAG: hypothetical protein J6B64_02995 [Bacilli bacterium]|nr:hypothetical protein [Bacilli bacterium]MBO5376348.1 hypothetical protein [Bacilli bacterium]MBP3597599.1 hypothetical protein [Clostridia bacterium]
MKRIRELNPLRSTKVYYLKNNKFFAPKNTDKSNRIIIKEKEKVVGSVALIFSFFFI